MDYIAAGNVMTDIIIDSSGKLQPDRYIGGPAFFGLAGIKTYTDNCMIITNVGADFFDFYGEWLDTNAIDKSGIRVLTEHTGVHELKYLEDGTYLCESVYGNEHRGHLKTRVEDLVPHIKNAKGLYISFRNDNIFFDELKKLKDQYGFKIMWEWGWSFTEGDKIADILVNIKKINYFSINFDELSEVTGCTTQQEAINILKELPCEAVWLRLGAKGGCIIANGESYFIPTPPTKLFVDATGCGNSTCATIMYALTEGYDPIMAGIMANVMAGYNIRQFGAYPVLTKEIQNEALAYAKKLYKEYTVRG